MFLSSEKQVIDIQQQNQRVVLHNLKVKVGIDFTLGEAQYLEITVDLRIPSSQCLLESIEGLLQSAYMGLLPMNHEPLRVLDVQLFLNYAIEECGLHIYLGKTPSQN